ncbi:MAG TPA: hypothetical protein VMK05_10095, partial [Burkholderiales bacterium]|nr:hypothetical protein [Burkholderiales bacterium]
MLDLDELAESRRRGNALPGLHAARRPFEQLGRAPQPRGGAHGLARRRTSADCNSVPSDALDQKQRGETEKDEKSAAVGDRGD